MYRVKVISYGGGMRKNVNYPPVKFINHIICQFLFVKLCVCAPKLR